MAKPESVSGDESKCRGNRMATIFRQPERVSGAKATLFRQPENDKNNQKDNKQGIKKPFISISFTIRNDKNNIKITGGKGFQTAKGATVFRAKATLFRQPERAKNRL